MCMHLGETCYSILCSFDVHVMLVLRLLTGKNTYPYYFQKGPVKSLPRFPAGLPLKAGLLLMEDYICKCKLYIGQYLIKFIGPKTHDLNLTCPV